MSATTTTIRKSYGNRQKLFTFPEDYPFRAPKSRGLTANLPKKNEEVNKLIKYVDDNVVGKNNAFLGPFGRRKVVFCDYAASGRSLQFIEEYILREVLPTYGNTHFTTSISSLQTTLFRQEARDIIRNAVNAREEDAVIFCGHGCKDALEKLIHALDIRDPPIIFTGASEHLDNLQLWQKTDAKLVRIAETKEGFLDLNDLENQLRFYQNCGKQLIGCFSIASSATGIVIDDVACTMLLHQYGSLAFWDYNMGAPSIQIDMNPNVPGVEENSPNKDAIYFSGHKFIGGVQTPGILIAKKNIFRRLVTCEPDGIFASQEHNKSFELQEEGSCAAVIESIRAGLVMQLKETVSVNNILLRQEKINKQMLQHIRTIPEIILLGNNSPNIKRISVFSFMVRHPRGTFLHHNFVCAVLNDVFGIQARSGCPCSASYAQELLGIDECLADQYENILLEDRRLSSLNLGTGNSTLELLRPGFTRICLPYFINDAELAFVMEAVKMVATEAWKLLPQYVVDLETGEWRHHTNAVSKDKKWLSQIRYVDGKMTMNERRVSGPGLFPQNYSECLQTARNLFNRARKTANRIPYQDQGITFDSRSEKLRWFLLQSEAQSLLTSNAQNVKQTVPFDPISSTNKKSENTKDSEPHTITQPVSTCGSPRHYSLPSIDDPRLITNSSPVPYFLHDVNGLYYPQMTQPTVNFQVGDPMTSPNFNHLQQNFVRERCLSLGAPNISPPVLSPQTRLNLGMGQPMRTRQLSYSSQNELTSLESDPNLSPTHSLNMLYSSNNDLGRNSPAPDLQTLFSEMTKEIATNIKSEIREVISKVEDVLENTDTSSLYERHGSGSEDGRSDSISANEVAEYLEKCSNEMVNDIKTEIREVVSAVDVFITPDQDKPPYSRHSSSSDEKNTGTIPKNEKRTPGSSSETVKNLINKSSSSYKIEDETSAGNKITPSTVASVSSQDSGINLSFQDQEFLQGEFSKSRSNSESLHHRNSESEIKFSSLNKAKPMIFREFSEDNQLISDSTTLKWSSPHKAIWQPCMEALQEFEMIKDGDKVMVCMSGGKGSLSLLHTLLHYQNYVKSKGILFSVGAVTVDPDSTGCDLLIPHLRRLGVHFIIDDKKGDPNDIAVSPDNIKENLYSFCTAKNRHRLYNAAKSSGYNVLAVGQHLDDLCECFMLSIFHAGKLRTMKAHYYIKEHDLRVLRPFVYVREKALRQFINNNNLPVTVNPDCVNISKERQRVKQLLTQQEILFPKLFTCLRDVLHDLIGFQVKDLKTRKRLKSRETEGSDVETDEELVVKG